MLLLLLSIILALATFGFVFYLYQKIENPWETAYLTLPEKALLYVDHEIETEIFLKNIEVEQLLRVNPGQIIPSDGVVVFGSSFVEEGIFSGLSTPVAKSAGAIVYSGSQNKNGSFIYRVTKTATESSLAKLAKQVSGLKKAEPIFWIFTLAFSAVLSTLLFALPETNFLRLMTLACGIFFASPYVLGKLLSCRKNYLLYELSKYGVLFSSKKFLPLLQKIDALILEKTGVLTEARPKISSIHIVPEKTEECLLQLAATLEAHVPHPLAYSLTQEARTRKIPLLESHDLVFYSGQGVSAVIEEQSCVIGNADFLRTKNISVETLATAQKEAIAREETPIFLAIDQKLAALFCFKDSIRQGTDTAISLLHKFGIHLILVSQDDAEVVFALAKKLQIAHTDPARSMEARAALLEKLKAEKFYPAALSRDGELVLGGEYTLQLLAPDLTKLTEVILSQHKIEA